MKKKDIKKIVIAIIITLVALFAVKKITAVQTEKGNKTIHLVVQTSDTEIYNNKVRTDAELLGDLLDELVQKEELIISFSGEKDGIYGRSIMTINGYDSDWNLGPWWFINSDNNKEALELGFCNGCDLQPIHDGDNFVLSLESSY